MSSTAPLLQHGLPYLWRGSLPQQRIGQWLMITAGSVVGMIHIGGLTRLTQSGLSMTDWTPLGGLPPLSHKEWQREFQRYQTFPEWQQRKSMTLEEFQTIYAWEYGHRMLGRMVGVIFVLPWMVFTARGMVPAGVQPRLALLAGMGATQGLVGWWMVQSGLGEDRRHDIRQIRVTPERLTAHLSMAVATYGVLCWTGWDMLTWSQQASLGSKVATLTPQAIQHARKLRGPAMALTALTATTLVSGALVAGNDAGRAFNTWPTMNGEWIPSEYGELVPWTRNIIEHTPTVQFHHRVVATTTAISAYALAYKGWQHRASVTPQVRRGLAAVALVTGAQFTLGVVTLISYVPVSLAAAHQLGSIAVLTSSLYLCHSLKYVRPSLLRTIPSTAIKTMMGK
jgi:heme a synthase